MAGSATLSANINGNIQGAAFGYNPSGALPAIVGTTKSDILQDVTSVGAALNVGTVGTVGLIAAEVRAGTAAATVSFYLDAGFTQLIAGAVAQGLLACVLVNPGTIYSKASAGTVSVRVFALPQ